MDRVLKADLFKEFGREDLEMILDEALKVCKGALAESNTESDRIGAKWDSGKVTMPESSHRAFKDLVEGGWIGATASPEYGGMGLPELMGTAIQEFIMGANIAFSLTPLLTRGTAHLIESFGTDELKNLYCEKMYTGEWTGTMCLTEPGAGSDLGDIKTKATKTADGKYMLKGEKIFITSGEHDLTENIIHAVLARTPEAPVGSKGLSLFLVPKFRVNPDGSIGEFNDVRCEKIEHKMGIHGSPTCALLFGGNDACEGYLLGRERLGLLLMFQMMNSARYEVGLQGLAVASAAHQAAISFAKERLQGRRHTDKDPHSPQIPIVEHPDVKRMLLFQATSVQAMRALMTYTAFCMDMAKVSEGDEKDYHQGMVEILTPICKAWCSDLGFTVADSAMQCYGGYGYTSEFPAEQYVRDARIAAIYEGTNGIQALDLLGRKLKLKGGDYFRRFMDLPAKTASDLSGHAVLGEGAAMLDGALKEILGTIEDISKSPDPAVANLLNAVPMLESLASAFGAHLLLDQAHFAGAKLDEMLKSRGIGVEGAAAFIRDNDDARFYHNKVQSALFFCRRVLPMVHAKCLAVRKGDMSPIEAMF